MLKKNDFGCLATRETIELTKTMAENGADVAMVVNPSFYKGVINVIIHSRNSRVFTCNLLNLILTWLEDFNRLY